MIGETGSVSDWSERGWQSVQLLRVLLISYRRTNYSMGFETSVFKLVKALEW